MVRLFTVLFLFMYGLASHAQDIQMSRMPDAVLWIRSFDTNKEGTKLAMFVSPSPDIAVIDMVTGRELARLKSTNILVEDVYFDDSQQRIIGIFNDSVHVWSANTYERLLSFKNHGGFSTEYNEATQKLALMGWTKIKLVDINTGIVTDSIAPTTKDERFSPGDMLHFDEKGEWIYFLESGSITRYNISRGTQIPFSNKNIKDFIPTESAVVGFRENNNKDGSRVELQWYALDGTEMSGPIIPERAFQAYFPTLQPFLNNNVLLSTFTGIDLINKEGNEYFFSLNEKASSFKLLPGRGFVINYGKKIEMIDTEGRLISHIRANSTYHSAGYMDREQSRYFHVSDGLVFNQEISNEETSGMIDTLDFHLSNSMIGKDNTAVFATRDGSIHVWNTESNEELFQSNGGTQIASFVGICTDKKWVAAVLRDSKEVLIYNYSSKKLVQKLTVSNHPSSFDMNSDWIVVGMANGSFSSWRISDSSIVPNVIDKPFFGNPVTSIEIMRDEAFFGSTGRIVKTSLALDGIANEQLLVGHISNIQSLSIDPSERFLVSSSYDGMLNIWNLEYSTLMESIPVDSAWINNVNVYDSLLIVGYGPGMVSSFIYNPALYQKLNNPNPELLIQSSNTAEVRKIAFSPDGKLLANIDGDKIKVREVRTGFMVSEMTTKNGIINDLEFDNNGTSIIVAAGKGLEYFDPLTGVGKKNIEMKLQGRSIHEVEVYPKQNLVLAINHHGWHFPIFLHQNSGQHYGTFNYNPAREIDDNIINLKISSKEKYLATFGSHYIKVFEADENLRYTQIIAIPRKTPKVFNEYWVDLLSFSLDEKYLSMVEFGSPNSTKVYDIENRSWVFEEAGKLSIFQGNSDLLKMSSDVSLESISLLDDSRKRLRSQYKHNRLIQALAYDSNQHIAASADIWGNLKIWDLNFSRTLEEVERFSNDIYHSEISLDGRYLSYNSKQGIFLFDLKELSTIDLKGTNYPYFGAFSKDGESFFFRREEELWVHHLESGNKELVLNSNIEKENAGSTILSTDDQFIMISNQENGDYIIFETASGKSLYTFNKNEVGNYTTFSPSVLDGENRRVLGVGIKKENESYLSLVLIEYNLKSKKARELSNKRFQKIADMEGWDGISMRYNTRINSFTTNLSEYAYLEDYHFKVEDLKDHSILVDQWNRELKTATYSELTGHLIVGSEDGKIKVFDKGTEIQNFQGAKGDISSLQANGRFLLVLGADDKVNAYDIEDHYKLIYTCSFMGDGEFVIANEEGYYYASKGAIKSVAFKKGAQVYPFEQFDLVYNRPDLAVKNLVNLEITSTNLALAFERAYKKRLKKSGFTEAALTNTFELPEVTLFTEGLPATTTHAEIRFRVKANDTTIDLQKLDLWVNDVPINGSSGMEIDGEIFEGEVAVNLTTGRNKIQVSVTNSKGIESLKRTFSIEYTGQEEKANLYIVSIGASEYSSSDFNLKYAAKDASDLAKYTGEALSEKYGEIFTTTLLNEQVNLDEISKIKEVLMTSNPEDAVILFYAGHGLLDSNLDYYFATYQMNFLDPAEKGLAYEDLEGLLDGIPARKKLLLIDACHSGEIDKDEVIASTKKVESGSVMFRGFSGYEMKKSELGLTNSFELMQMMFADLRRGTGAMVISSAGGVEFALEGEEWNNGVFTYSLLDGLKSGDCDLNNDGEIKVSELREYVIGRVDELTNGQQNPTSRKENLEFDFSIW